METAVIEAFPVYDNLTYLKYTAQLEKTVSCYTPNQRSQLVRLLLQLVYPLDQQRVKPIMLEYSKLAFGTVLPESEWEAFITRAFGITFVVLRASLDPVFLHAAHLIVYAVNIEKHPWQCAPFTKEAFVV